MGDDCRIVTRGGGAPPRPAPAPRAGFGFGGSGMPSSFALTASASGSPTLAVSFAEPAGLIVGGVFGFAVTASLPSPRRFWLMTPCEISHSRSSLPIAFSVLPPRVSVQTSCCFPNLPARGL